MKIIKMNRKNISIILTILLLFFSICFINYKIDPYNIYKNTQINTSMFGREELLDVIYLRMKYKKNNKYDTLIIGSSLASSLFGPPNLRPNNVFLLSYNGGSIKNNYEMLSAFLDLHPETKKVYIIFNYAWLYEDAHLCLTPYTGKYYNLNELYFFLYSLNTTKKSFQVLIDNIKNQFLPKPVKKNEELTFEPHDILSYSKNENVLKLLNNYENKNYFYLKKTNELLNKKNIEYTYIIPPHNASFLVVVHKNKLYKEKLENMKQFLVENSQEVYDLAFINKYTKTSMLKDNVLFINYNHVNELFGIIIYKIFFDSQNADHSLYKKLTKSNINKIIKEENDLLDNFYTENKEYSDLYIEIAEGKYSEEYKNQKLTTEFEKIPKDLQSEYDYFNSHIKS